MARWPDRLLQGIRRQGGRAERYGSLGGRAGADRPVTASKNLDLVPSIYAAWERGDFTSVEWAHPEIELVAADGAAPGSGVGLAAMAEGMRDFLSAWANLRA